MRGRSAFLQGKWLLLDNLLSVLIIRGGMTNRKGGPVSIFPFVRVYEWIVLNVLFYDFGGHKGKKRNISFLILSLSWRKFLHILYAKVNKCTINVADRIINNFLLCILVFSVTVTS